MTRSSALPGDMDYRTTALTIASLKCVKLCRQELLCGLVSSQQAAGVFNLNSTADTAVLKLALADQLAALIAASDASLSFSSAVLDPATLDVTLTDVQVTKECNPVPP